MNLNTSVRTRIPLHANLKILSYHVNKCFDSFFVVVVDLLSASAMVLRVVRRSSVELASEVIMMHELLLNQRELKLS